MCVFAVRQRLTKNLIYCKQRILVHLTLFFPRIKCLNGLERAGVLASNVRRDPSLAFHPHLPLDVRHVLSQIKPLLLRGEELVPRCSEAHSHITPGQPGIVQQMARRFVPKPAIFARFNLSLPSTKAANRSVQASSSVNTFSCRDKSSACSCLLVSGAL